MDKYNLLFFTMGKIDDENSASSGKKPGTVSRKRQGDDSRSSSKKSKPADMEQLQLHRMIVSNVARIGDSVAVVAYGALASQQESFQEKIFKRAMKKLECTDARAKTLIGERISQLKCSMEQVEENIDCQAVGPRTIDFAMREPSPPATLATNHVSSPSDTRGANSVASPATTPTPDEEV